ncbi:MAG: hypothetical protein KatS3mg114_0008 [Planctomycetaceae bacterium]|nr:MAG: hypothetical protein KatS3mg114_0008 [Planctomycetaceae bacterium]
MHAAETTSTSSPPWARYPLHLVIREDALNILCEREWCHEGPVTDRLDEAFIQGSQRTEFHLRFDLLPCPNTARGRFVLTGRAHTHTVSYTPQALIWGTSFQPFRCTKEVFLQSGYVATRWPDWSSQVDYQPTFIHTPWDASLMLGSLARQLTAQQTWQRLPRIETFLRQRLHSRIVPDFQQRIDDLLATFNRRLEALRSPAVSISHCLPQQVVSNSTDDYLHLACGWSDWSAVYNPPDPRVLPLHSVLVFIHRTAIEQSFQRLARHRKQLSFDELQQQLKAWQPSRQFNDPSRAITVPAGIPLQQLQLIFPDHPLTVQWDHESMHLQLSIDLVLSEDAQPLPLIIAWSGKLHRQDDTWQLETQQLQLRSSQATSWPLPALFNAIQENARQTLERTAQFPRAWQLPLEQPTITLCWETCLLHQEWLILGFDVRSGTTDTEISREACAANQCTRRDSNPQPSVPKTDALSN